MEDIASDVGCVSCGENATASRCEHCGVAQAPGGYVVERVVAQTRHSRLYRATAPDGSPVAVKELLFALVPDARALESFERESALLKTLDHPQIPKFIDSFQEGRGAAVRLYLVQEFVDGMSLADLVDRRRFNEAQAERIAREVLLILDYLHSLSPRVVHRDVKPANLIQKPDGTLVLVDFDAARDLDRNVTHRATMVGTFGYMPPEQLGGTVDVTSDLYALGATLVHLLSRRPPTDLFVAGQGFALRDHVHVSERFLAWLEKMCAVNRADRYQSAREALRALDAAATMPAPVVRKGNAKLVVFIGLAALAAAGSLSVGAVALFQSLSQFKAAPEVPPPIQRPPVVVPPAPPVKVEPSLEPEPVFQSVERHTDPPAPRPLAPPPPSRAQRVQRVGSSFDKQPLVPGIYQVNHTMEFGDAPAPVLTISRVIIAQSQRNGLVPVTLRGNVRVPKGSVTARLKWVASGDGVETTTVTSPAVRAGRDREWDRDLAMTVPVDLYSTSFNLEVSNDGLAKKATINLVKPAIVGR